MVESTIAIATGKDSYANATVYKIRIPIMKVTRVDLPGNGMSKNSDA